MLKPEKDQGDVYGRDRRICIRWEERYGILSSSVLKLNTPVPVGEKIMLRRFPLGKAAMTALYNIWKDTDKTITTKCRILNALAFPVLLYGCDSWTIRKAERIILDSFELWCWRRLIRISWTARRTHKSVIKEIKSTSSL